MPIPLFNKAINTHLFLQQNSYRNKALVNRSLAEMRHMTRQSGDITKKEFEFKRFVFSVSYNGKRPKEQTRVFIVFVRTRASLTPVDKSGLVG